MFYRITPEESAAIEAFQKSHPLFKYLLGSPLAVEHNHTTGLIRGRLEWRLNKAYGIIEQVAKEHTADVLRALAEFHINPPATTVLGAPRYGIIGRAKYKKKMVYGPPEK